MAQGLDGVFDHSLIDDPRPDGERRSLRWLAVPVILAVGWGIFFGYTAVFLSESVPHRPHHDGEQVDARAMQSAFGMIPEPLRALIDTPSAREPEPSPVLPDPATTEAVPAAQAADPQRADAPAASSAVVVSRTPDLERADFVGVWGPTQAACQSPSRRDGFIQAKITPGGAKAGRTTCNFRDSRRTGNAWVMAADCTDGGRRWSSQVRLTVDGDRLTWSSAKGASAYVRCGRREG